jgi:hypothetical protein
MTHPGCQQVRSRPEKFWRVDCDEKGCFFFQHSAREKIRGSIEDAAPRACIHLGIALALAD